MFIREQSSSRTPIPSAPLSSMPRWFPPAQRIYHAMHNPLVFALVVVVMMIGILAL